jgi:hypothetical protein
MLGVHKNTGQSKANNPTIKSPTSKHKDHSEPYETKDEFFRYGRATPRRGASLERVIEVSFKLGQQT